jgi:sec-independent protein translocase protein TatC
MSSSPDDKDSAESQLDPAGEMTFVEHLVEVRDRLVRVLAVVVVVLLVLLPFANDLYVLLAEPLMRHLPEGASMIATEVAAPFLTPFKLALMSSIFLSMPVVLYHAWAFVAPGLYRHERKLVFPLLITSSILFYLGMAFAYYVVFPLMFGFFTATAPEGVAVMTDISRYLDFVLKIFFAFGVAFEVPIATILLVWAGFTTPQSLAQKRPYVIVGAFVLGMLLTPPDAISQTLLALPMWVLFELGLLFARAYVKPRREEEEPAAPADT